jgi:hypothetical protein
MTPSLYTCVIVRLLYDYPQRVTYQPGGCPPSHYTTEQLLLPHTSEWFPRLQDH